MDPEPKPDQPTPATGAPAPTPTPAPAAVPSQAAAPPSPQEDPYDPDKFVLVTDEQGGQQVARLGDLADAWVGQQKDGKLSPGKPAAPASPAGEPAKPEGASPPADAPPAESETIQTLQKQVEDLTKVIQTEVVPLTSQIATLRDASEFNGLVQQHKDKLPYTAKHPQAGQAVKQQYDGLLEVLRQSGKVDVDNLTNDQQSELVATAMRRTESALRGTAEIYEGFRPEQVSVGEGEGEGGAASGTPSGTASPEVVDDQADRADISTKPAVSARYTVVNGVLMDHRGRAVTQEGERRFATLDAEVPAANPSGTNVPASAGAEQRAGPQTREMIEDRMRRRRQEIQSAEV